MKIEQAIWTPADGWTAPTAGGGAMRAPQLVLFFAAPDQLAPGEIHAQLKARYPQAHILGCTTGGEILGSEVHDGSIVATAVEFETASVRLAAVPVATPEASRDAGAAIGRALDAADLRCVFVLSDGVHVNGTKLVEGITGALTHEVPVTGGLAGDGERFGTALVAADDALAERRAAAVGLYGDTLAVGHGSIGGWTVFGPERVITRSEGTTLYELDGKPALDLYKRYLGEDASKLPGSALLFPLTIHKPGEPDNAVVRTIVGIDEAERALIFAGDVPEGDVAQLMMGNFEKLIEGAADAAHAAAVDAGKGALAILVSCVGRKWLLGPRIGEETEVVEEELGGHIPQIGFYSYGEISPHAVSGMCELHNQTMTITVLGER
jgi:hypothetical protein